jgi:predicted RNA binding protein with dsRBD fold (UPF0201 family)
VVIGIDPHKASHTAVAVDGDEEPLSSVKVRATRKQVEQLLDWAEPLRETEVGHRVCWRSRLPLGPAARRSG